MSKIFWNNYRYNPKHFFDSYRKFRLDSLTKLDLVEDTKILFPRNNQIKPSASTDLVSAAYGYRISISPLQSLCLFNAVANNGKMMKPYLVSAIQENGNTIKEIEPTVLNEKICSDTTINLAKICLEGVCSSPVGSARELFKDCDFKVAGKTGTNLIGYNVDRKEQGVYQSSFIGYFPADNPQYTIAVVIKNTANQAQYYGGQVAAPVFKEIANRLYTTYVKNSINIKLQNQNVTSSLSFNGFRNDAKTVLTKSGISYNDNHFEDWIKINGETNKLVVEPKTVTNRKVPNLKGLTAKDAIYLCESLGLKVNLNGMGKVNTQSIIEGTRINIGQTINISLN
jgi:cell division protein FtsI (penicillin-binding protein 3)